MENIYWTAEEDQQLKELQAKRRLLNDTYLPRLARELELAGIPTNNYLNNLAMHATAIRAALKPFDVTVNQPNIKE